MSNIGIRGPRSLSEDGTSATPLLSVFPRSRDNCLDLASAQDIEWPFAVETGIPG